MNQFSALLCSLLVLFPGSFAPAGFSSGDADATTIILVRHAERLDESSNANLSPAGLARSEALVETLGAINLAGIYSTNFCRTALTAQPLAKHFSLPLQIQQLSASGGFEDCKPAVTVPLENLPSSLNEGQSFIDYLLEQHAGQTVLVVGHSNTTPNLVNVLGAGKYDLPHIAHEVYNDLYIVKKHGEDVELIKATYGS